MTRFDEILPSVIKSLKPRWGIVLGSGLGQVADRAEIIDQIPYGDVSGMPVSNVPGHAGKFIVARLAGQPVVIAQGRVHLYEGYSAADVTAGIRFLAGCGIGQVVLTNAAGSLNPGFLPSEWMMIADHLNLTGTSPLLGEANFVDMTEVYSLKLREHFRVTATATGLRLHTGTYAGLVGPQYETPAEIRMLRSFGADAVGMSTVLEAIQARALGVEVIGFSCLSNWAAGLSPEPLSHEEVLRTGTAAASGFCELLQRALETWRD